MGHWLSHEGPQRPALNIVAEALYCERPCLAGASPDFAVATLPSVAAPACALDQFAAFFANDLPRMTVVYDSRSTNVGRPANMLNRGVTAKFRACPTAYPWLRTLLLPPPLLPVQLLRL